MLYKFDWISSLKPENEGRLRELSERMAKFYSSKASYYNFIDSGNDAWKFPYFPPCNEIINKALQSEAVLELGCGGASILRVAPALEAKYSGVEFSREVIEMNKTEFPKASFKVIDDPYRYDFPDASFDFIFSFFVIEHTVFPDKFLRESLRLLKPGGTLVVFAPNFMDNLFVPSQRASSSLLTGTESLKKFRLKDAFTSLLYRKFLIPGQCKQKLKGGKDFWINCDPAAFYFDETLPDLDAVHVTSFHQIKEFLKANNCIVKPNSAELENFIRDNRLGYICAEKN